MRKTMLFIAVSVALTLSACGSGSTTNEATDSTQVQVDTTVAPVVDTVSAPVGGGSGKEQPEQPVEKIK
jgi:uncharacterized protein YceK